MVSNAVSERWTPASDGRVLAALCVAAFLASLNFFATTPFYAPMARDLHTTIPLLGQVVTLTVLLSAGLGLVVGPLADRYGYRWPLMIGVLAIAVNLLGMGLAAAYPVLLGLSEVGAKLKPNDRLDLWQFDTSVQHVGTGTAESWRAT